jgi:hypothetical protein
MAIRQNQKAPPKSAEGASLLGRIIPTKANRKKGSKPPAKEFDPLGLPEENGSALSNDPLAGIILVRNEKKEKPKRKNKKNGKRKKE